MPTLRTLTIAFVGTCAGLVAAVLPATPAVAAPVTCGSSITMNTRLDRDLDCGSGVALQLDGTDIVLNLGGHTISGTGVGIHSTFGQRSTIRNGTIRGFTLGVDLDRTVGMRIQNVRFVDNRTAVNLSRNVDTTVVSNRIVGSVTDGVSVSLSNRTQVRRNVLRGNGVGISLSFASNSTVSRNRVTRSGGDGIAVLGSSSGTTVSGNAANRNGDDGIDVDNASTTVTRNTANRNGDLGIEAVDGVTDGGGNTARRNGNPAQCTGVACGRGDE
jgi:parallel beta-helix repeat protein